MLAEDELDRVCVVLVRARNPNNVGAVARAMHGFGFRHLRLVSNYPVALEEARSAVDASEVLADAQTYAGVAEAVADCNLVVGTTAAGKRVQEHPLHALAEAGSLLRNELVGEGRVALLFGSEKTGLSNEELSHCQWLMTIPMYEREGQRHSSMNLGQAAAVCLYELVRDVAAPDPSVPSVGAAAADLERLTKLLMELLDESGHPPNLNEAQVRRLVRRMGLNSSDATAWIGFLRQVLWKIRRGDVTGGPS